MRNLIVTLVGAACVLVLAACAENDSGQPIDACDSSDHYCENNAVVRCVGGAIETVEECEADERCVEAACVPLDDGDLDGDVADGDATDGDLADGDADGDAPDGDLPDGDGSDGDADGDGDGDGDESDGDVPDGDCECSDEVCCDGCHWIADDGACDDGLDCTENDNCKNRQCAGTLKADACFIDDGCVAEDTADPDDACFVCKPSVDPHTYSPATGTACGDDNRDCTDDICDDGVCTHPLKDDRCLIAGLCYATDERSEDNDCQVCDPTRNVGAWSTLADDTACDSGSDCAVTSVCQSGKCAVTELIANDCGARACGMSPSGCHNCGICANAGACDLETYTCVDNCGDMGGLRSGAPWPMAGYCPTHQGRSLYAAAATLVADFIIATHAPIKSEPVLDPDGRMFFASDALYAYGLFGAQIFSVDIGLETNGEASLVLAADGEIFGVGVDGKIYCISASGETKWVYDTESYVTSAPLIGPDGTLYVASWDGKVYAIGEHPPDWPGDVYEGEKKWEFEADSAIVGGAIMLLGDRLITATDGGTVYAINIADGTEAWSFSPETQTSFSAAPVLTIDGKIVIGAENGELYILQPQDGYPWDIIDLYEPVTTPAAIGYSGEIVVSAGDILSCFDSHGTLWETQAHADDTITSPPVIAPDGRVYVGTEDGRLIGLDMDSGEVVFKEKLSQQRITARPIISPEGWIYIGAWDGTLRSYRPAITKESAE